MSPTLLYPPSPPLLLYNIVTYSTQPVGSCCYSSPISLTVTSGQTPRGPPSYIKYPGVSEYTRLHCFHQKCRPGSDSWSRGAHCVPRVVISASPPCLVSTGGNPLPPVTPLWQPRLSVGMTRLRLQDFTHPLCVHVFRQFVAELDVYS